MTRKHCERQNGEKTVNGYFLKVLVRHRTRFFF